MRAADDILRCLPLQLGVKPDDIPPWEAAGLEQPDPALIHQDMLAIKHLMWNYVGIVRREKRLHLVQRLLGPVLEEIREHFHDYLLTPDLVELRNIAVVAELIIRSAASRKESRGLHYMVDYPGHDDARFKKDTVLARFEA